MKTIFEKHEGIDGSISFVRLAGFFPLFNSLTFFYNSNILRLHLRKVTGSSCFLTFLNLDLSFLTSRILFSPAVAHLPNLIGTFPHLIADLQVTKGHVEVALVFVDVLQGFEIFVHTTEIWMDNNHSKEQTKKLA